MDRHALGIFGVNGFTGLLTAICGGLLLFGAAQHHLAKTMSLIVGVVLGAAAIIALISGNVLGLAAANGWTELAWGIAAAILLINAMLPARRRVIEPAGAGGRTAGAAGTGAAAGAAAGDMAARRQTRRSAAAEDPAYTGTGTTAGTGTAAGAGTGTATGAGTGAASGAGTGTTTGAGTGAGAGTGGGEGGPAAEDRDVSYTHRITGGSAAGQPVEGEPVGVGGRETAPQTMPAQGAQTTPAQGAQTTRSGGVLGRLFGRRS